MTSDQRWCNYMQWCWISWQTHSLFLHSNPIFEDLSVFITSFRHPKQELMIQINKFLHDESISLHSKMYENLKTQPAIWMVSNLDILQTVYERNPSITEMDPLTVCLTWCQGKNNLYESDYLMVLFLSVYVCICIWKSMCCLFFFPLTDRIGTRAFTELPSGSEVMGGIHFIAFHIFQVFRVGRAFLF